MKIKLLIERAPGQEGQPRSLEELCLHHKFELKLVGMHYCGLANTERVQCHYKADSPDKNGLYICMKHQEMRIFIEKHFKFETQNATDHPENKGKERTFYT